MEIWKIAISALCGILLVVVVIALIFKNDFRQDLLAGTGTASFFGLFSVHGAHFLLFVVVLLVGLLYPVIGSNDGEAELTRFIESLQFDETHPDSVRNKIKELKSQTGSLRIEDLPNIIDLLVPESEISNEIRRIADEGKGPWSPYSTSIRVLISVPGNLTPGKVYGCPNLYEREIQLISNYRRSGVVLRGSSSIKVKVNGLVYQALDCREVLGYDLQLNCQDAQRLLSDKVLTCDDEHNPLYSLDIEERLFPAFGAVIIEGS